MCDTIVLLNGTELGSIGQMREYGFIVKESISDGECLCILDFPEFFESDNRSFKKGWFPFPGWAEIDEEGRDYWNDAFFVLPHPEYEDMFFMEKRGDWPHGFEGDE